MSRLGIGSMVNRLKPSDISFFLNQKLSYLLRVGWTVVGGEVK